VENQVNLELHNLMIRCQQCSLANSRTQVVIGDYGPIYGMLFIGEAPGQEEDRIGRPFVGRSGKLLDEMLSQLGLDRSKVSVLNINKCRPPNNRAPTPTEMEICGSNWLDKQIKNLVPKLIITLGSTPLKYFFPNAKMTASKGNLLVLNSGIPVYPLFHPSYILRKRNLYQEYKKDFIAMYKYYLKLKNLDQIITPIENNQSNLDNFF